MSDTSPNNGASRETVHDRIARLIHEKSLSYDEGHRISIEAQLASLVAAAEKQVSRSQQTLDRLPQTGEVTEEAGMEAHMAEYDRRVLRLLREVAASIGAYD